MRPMLNCWIAAIWLWVASRGRAYIWTRRSKHFKGLIPHAGTAFEGSHGKLFAVEYVPDKAALWTRRNFVLLFDGTYRVWELKVVKVRRFKTARAMQEYLRAAR